MPWSKVRACYSKKEATGRNSFNERVGIIATMVEIAVLSYAFEFANDGDMS